MSFVIGPKLEIVFRCRQCGEVIQRLDEGVYFDASADTSLAAFADQTIIVHSPLAPGKAHDCLESWMEAHPGGWRWFDLVTFLTLLGTQYPGEYQETARLAAERNA